MEIANQARRDASTEILSEGRRILALALLALSAGVLSVIWLDSRDAQNLLLAGLAIALLARIVNASGPTQRASAATAGAAIVLFGTNLSRQPNPDVDALVLVLLICALVQHLGSARLPLLVPASLAALLLAGTRLVESAAPHPSVIQGLAGILTIFSMAGAFAAWYQGDRLRLPTVLCFAAAALPGIATTIDSRMVWITSTVLLVGTALMLASTTPATQRSRISTNDPGLDREQAIVALVALLSGSSAIAYTLHDPMTSPWPVAGAIAAGSIGILSLLGGWWDGNARTMARLAAAAVESRTDPLTQLQNRRGLEERLAEEIARAKRYRHPFSIMMIDLDDFKAINDRLGHQTGDLVLQTTARVIEASIRAIDLASRYGGEEFLILLPETDIEGALVVAERIRSSIERSGQVTASIGIAEMNLADLHASDLIAQADSALYDAKQAGKNRIALAD